MGLLKLQTLERVIKIWHSNIDNLKNHKVVLVHGTATPWTIYLEKDAVGQYYVSRMGAMDHLWWDAAFDLTMLRWPPLFTTVPGDWQAFVQSYGLLPDDSLISQAGWAGF